MTDNEITTEPRAYTEDEVREMFLRHLAGLAKHWAETDGVGDVPPTALDRCNGVAFGILSTLDGVGLTLPSMLLMLNPHPDDESFRKSNGENWFPADVTFNDSLSLHEQWHRYQHGNPQEAADEAGDTAAT